MPSVALCSGTGFRSHGEQVALFTEVAEVAVALGAHLFGHALLHGLAVVAVEAVALDDEKPSDPRGEDVLEGA